MRKTIRTMIILLVFPFLSVKRYLERQIKRWLIVFINPSTLKSVIALRLLSSKSRVATTSWWMALAVFLGALLLGGLLGSFIAPFIPFNFGNLTLIQGYTINIVGFLVTGIISFPVLVYLNRASNVEGEAVGA